MNRAANTATERLTDYFRCRHDVAPFDEAEVLLRQITARRRWNEPFDFASKAYRLLQQIRIDVDDFIENYLGVTLRIERLEDLDKHAGSEVFGCADVRNRTIRICERTLGYEPLYRATAMHEAGHMILHGKASAVVHAYAPDARVRPPHEREADDFMVASVLPWEAVMLSVAATSLSWRMSMEEAINCANTPRGRYQWHEKYLPDLQSRMGVSKHLAALRLRKRGIITESTLQYHLSTGSAFRPQSMGTRFSKYHVSHVIEDVVASWE